ncbi:MAG: hypothetical protein IT430_15170 [Phycisphaerales bacterium]|nr:hypothetical protein [Phycisphaerales bacterium]
MRARHAALADRQLLFVGAAGVCGALVLMVLLFAGARNRVRQADGSPQISSDLLNTPIPDRDPDSRVRIGQARQTTGDPLQSLQTGRGELEFTNDDGLLAFRYRWDKSDPLETGWNRFTNPQAWIYRSDRQLIRLTSDEGMFRLAENRQPQAGVLTGHVVIAVYQSEERGGVYQINPDVTPPIAQFETDSLNFDAMQFTGRTQDRVVARTADAIMIGRGMDLAFNETLGRIEELEIAQRELIVYRQRDRKQEPASTSAASKPASANAPASTAENTAAPPSPPDPWDGATRYQLALTDEVIVEQGEREKALLIRGRDLLAEFALGPDSISEGGLLGHSSTFLPDGAARTPGASMSPSSAAANDRWAHLASLTVGAMIQPSVTFLGSSETPGPEDIRITGQGALRLTPADGSSEHLASPRDLYATLDGEPVHISYGSFYATGSDLEYSSSLAKATLNCRFDQPIEAGLPDGARLTSVAPFEYYFEKNELGRNTGTLLGAGTLVGLIPRPDDAPPGQPVETDFSSMKGLPEGFSVNWFDNFTVEFEGANEGSGLGRIAAAVFDGQVHVDDPNGYTLDSHRLRIDFKEKPDEQDGQRVESITATGEARLQSAQGNVNGDELFVLFSENAQGSSYPSQMTVTGQGRVADAGGSLAAQYIQADLIEPSMAAEEALPSAFGGSSSFAVSEVLAQGTVVLSFDGGVTALADRLEADARTDTAVLSGENVVVSDPSLKVMGKRAEISNISSKTASRIATFVGAGTLTYFEPKAPTMQDGAGNRAVTTPEQMREELRRRLNGEQPPPSPAPQVEPTEPASAPQAPAGDEVGAVHVEWTDQLTFEEAQGLITFHGGVNATSEPSDREIDRLSGNWMQIQLTDPIETRTTAGEPGKAVRRLQKMTMLGSRDRAAQVEAQRYTDATHAQREMLLAISSDVIEYSESTETFEAIGEGWMLVVDASESTPEPREAALQEGKPAVQFSGPGETEFTWTGRLSMRRSPGLLTIVDNVVMRHRPRGEPVVRVDCDVLTASLASKDSKSVSALDLSGNDGMELTSAVAEGAVFVRREDRSIWADRLIYDKSALLATIESTGDNYVVMETATTGGAVQARRILWDFFTNGITVEGARVDGPLPPINGPG